MSSHSSSSCEEFKEEHKVSFQFGKHVSVDLLVTRQTNKVEFGVNSL